MRLSDFTKQCFTNKNTLREIVDLEGYHSNQNICEERAVNIFSTRIKPVNPDHRFQNKTKDTKQKIEKHL